ncbi:hypothetical protein A2U01_0110513, partial [Trifolium medium]|nr:hypothetical protein [Trifolium medium]
MSQKKSDASTSQPVPVEPPMVNTGSDRANESVSSDFDEVLKLIKRSEYKVIDQLLQTPSKISI